ncbi:hypothetical protein ACFE04_014629 [Oxalis oulophora]
MKSFRFLFCFAFLSIFISSYSANIEVQTLLEFKSKLHDQANVLESWKVSALSPCDFYGVTCDKISGNVVEISLDNKSLSGQVSPLICNLHSLTVLSLPSNSFQGKLHPQFVECTNLRVLNITGNMMVGPVPDLSVLRKLEILDLSLNFFTGEFPNWVGNLTNLVSLGIGSNNYDQSEIPSSIGNLKNLTWLFLSTCNLIGKIPESLFELKELQTFDISNNNITGFFPSSISKLQKLSKIEFWGNKLTGEVPAGLANLTLLQEIDISSNHFYGKLPEGIGNLKHLMVFQCYNNNLSGEFPAGFGNMQHLTGFSIYRNKFSGVFPADFGRYSSLNSFDISENRFSGRFPRFLCENRNLEFLLALENNFTGEFPNSYSSCKSLQRVRINENSLSGKIPDEFWGLPLLQMIDLGDNEFSGEISTNIELATSLTQLILPNNKFSGMLPSGIGKLSNLEKLELSNNNFSGALPSEIGGLKQLSSLHLEENSFTGHIPAEFGNCLRLVDLNLASNSLTGKIPQTISLMSSLNSLNLSTNKLTGEIPENLNKMKLSFIDLSANEFSGVIPSDLLDMGGDKAFLGNEKLCVDQNSKSVTKSMLNVCNGDQHQMAKSENKLALFGILAAALLFIIAGLLIISYKNFTHSESEMESDLEDGKDANPKLAYFHRMEFNADEISNLDEDNLIGSGGTGKVYRLDLKRVGATVAVKQLRRGDGVKVLAAEMDILGRIRHRNILKLYASLLRADSSLLVLEYMANGNLYEALHREKKGGLPELDWHSWLYRSRQVADLPFPFLSFAELAYTCKVTEKSDIYSFGVVLLELVTGRKPVEDEYGEGKDIVYWVLTHLGDRENALTVLDNNVASEDVQEDIIKVLRIAIICTTKLPTLRPSMREVVNMLIDADPCTYKSPHTATPLPPPAVIHPDTATSHHHRHRGVSIGICLLLRILNQRCLRHLSTINSTVSNTAVDSLRHSDRCVSPETINSAVNSLINFLLIFPFASVKRRGQSAEDQPNYRRMKRLSRSFEKFENHLQLGTEERLKLVSSCSSNRENMILIVIQGIRRIINVQGAQFSSVWS